MKLWFPFDRPGTLSRASSVTCVRHVVCKVITMKNSVSIRLVVLAAILACAAEAAAQTTKATLFPGDPAPSIHVAKWLKGQPVIDIKKGQFYVVEFWATWCGPCIQSIPHLTEL